MTVKSQPGDTVLNIPDIQKVKVGIVVSEWNKTITEKLLEGARTYFAEKGVAEENILVHWVPGSFELPLGVKWLMEYKNVEGVACLGCIIKGETPHFHYISQAVSEKIASLSLATGRPVGFGIITADNGQQAIERAGGKVGNKGTEAADAVLRMLNIKYELKKSGKKTVGF